MACKGDGAQKCGGPAALSLFADTNALADPSKANGTKVVARRVESGETGNMIDMTREHMKRHGKKRHGGSILNSA